MLLYMPNTYQSSDWVAPELRTNNYRVLCEHRVRVPNLTLGEACCWTTGY